MKNLFFTVCILFFAFGPMAKAEDLSDFEGLRSEHIERNSNPIDLASNESYTISVLKWIGGPLVSILPILYLETRLTRQAGARGLYITDYMTKEWVEFIAKYSPISGRNLELMDSVLKRHFGTSILEPYPYMITDFAVPVFEELETRFFIQKLCMKEVPKALLNFAGLSTYADWLDHPIFVAGRVLSPAYFFALMHENCVHNRHRMNQVFIMGLILSAVQEYTENLYYPTALHILHNTIFTYILRPQ